MMVAVRLLLAIGLAGCATEPEVPTVPPSMTGTFRATVNGEFWNVGARFGALSTSQDPTVGYTGQVKLEAERVDSSEFGPHGLVMILSYAEFEQGDVLPLHIPQDSSVWGQGVELWEGEGGELVNVYRPLDGGPGDVRIDRFDLGEGALEATLNGTFVAEFPGNGPHPGYTDTVRVEDGVFVLEAADTDLR